MLRHAGICLISAPIFFRKEQCPLQAKWKSLLTHSLLALLYGLSVIWTLLGVLELSAYAGLAALTAAGLTAVLTVASLNKVLKWLVTGALGIGAVCWLMLGGTGVINEILLGVTLHLSGTAAALPMVARETTLVVSVIMSLAVYGLTQKKLGAYPCLALLMLLLLLLWLSGRTEQLPWLLPAALAVLTLHALSNHTGLSLRRVLPMMLVIVLGAAAVLPTGGVTIQPLKDAADNLRRLVYDYFFFTEPRDVFSLAIEGYYPQGQAQLGGKPQISTQPVMQVTTPRRTYLRGVIKNQYTGRAWLDTTGGRRYLWRSLRWEDSRDQLFDLLRPSAAVLRQSSLLEESTVSIRMLTGGASTLFVPQRLRSLHPGGDLVPYFNNSSEIFVTRNIQQDDVWSVQAVLLRSGDAGLGALLEACAIDTDDHYEAVRQEYTALPQHLPQELYDMARDITDGMQTPYDMALSLQQYLSSNYRYTLDVADQPTDQDFVATFLLQTKEGYCTYFASALTVLCRMVGLPARYVEGYVATPGPDGTALVTGENGHAWTEVYFSGFGWLTFDATPWAASEISSSSNNQQPPEESPQPSEEPSATPTPPPPSESEQPQISPTPQPSEAPLAEPSPEPSAEPEPDTPPSPAQRNTWPWWLLLLLLAAALRILLTTPRFRALRARDDLARWMVWSQALHDVLHAMKLRRAPEESPLSYMKRLDASARLPLRLLPQGQAESLMFYGHSAPEPEEIEFARQAYRQLFRALPWWRKPLLHLRRAFLPARKMDFTRA